MIVAGVDEAGVGCWAGPLVVVAAAFREDVELPKTVRDSKRLSMGQRENLIDEIYDRAEWVIIKTASPIYINSKSGIWSVWDEVVDEVLLECKDRKAGKIIVDGSRMIESCRGITYEVKADDKYREVSAASIVAKFVQTSAMEDLHERFPDFLFDQHHGYGTEDHRRKLEEFGPTPAHRSSYKPVASYLESHPDEARSLRQLELFDVIGLTTNIVCRR